MLVAAFAVILVTVVVQGVSLGWVIRLVAPGGRGSACCRRPRRGGSRRCARQARDGGARTPTRRTERSSTPNLLDMYRKRGAARPSATPVTPTRSWRHPSPFRRDPRRHRRRPRRTDPPAPRRADRGRGAHDLERDLDLEELGIIFQRGEPGSEANPPSPSRSSAASSVPTSARCWRACSLKGARPTRSTRSRRSSATTSSAAEPAPAHPGVHRRRLSC